MREIILPEPIVLGEVSFTLFDCVRLLLRTDKRFNTTMAGGFAAERIVKTMVATATTPGGVWRIESTDGDLLKQVFAQPTDGYPISPLYEMANMLRAIDGQKEVSAP